MASIIRPVLVGTALGILAGLNSISARAETTDPPRRKTIVVSYTQHAWWLTRWSDNSVICGILVEHDGIPSGREIFKACGDEASTQWLESEPCPAARDGGDLDSCEGLYLHWAEATTGQREVEVELPPASVWISLAGCSPASPSNRCEDLPSLLLTAEEPLPNEEILSIHGTLGGVAFSCTGSVCEVPLRITGQEGVTVNFWADSTYGDSSPQFTARVRVVRVGPSGPEQEGWYVDVLSTQWRGAPLASCSQVWDAFPPVGGSPAWLTTPKTAEALASDEPYAYLASMLIERGIVDAIECPGWVLAEDGVANACGLEVARPLVEVWQNQFDVLILEVANDMGVPAQLMKNLFARESQFWPGFFNDETEVGLGQLTEAGADATLLWNTSFYDEFCPLVLDADVCESGYSQLRGTEQAMLRGAVFSRASAQCEDCPTGIDLKRADFSVSVFAETVLANCGQVGQIVRNVTGNPPGAVSRFEDLWRFTLANYNAGPGCLAEAMEDAWLDLEALDWEHVAAHLAPACEGALVHVEQVARE